MSKTGGRDIFQHGYATTPYSIGSVNYLIDDSNSRELKKFNLTRQADRAEK